MHLLWELGLPEEGALLIEIQNNITKLKGDSEVVELLNLFDLGKRGNVSTYMCSD